MMKLKKLISTVLATVMAASVMSVGMISSASAATAGEVYAVFFLEADKTANDSQGLLDGSDIIEVTGHPAPESSPHLLDATYNLDGGKTITTTQRSDNKAAPITVTVPGGVTKATLYIGVNSSGDSAREFSTIPDRTDKTGDNNSASGSDVGTLVKLHGLVGGQKYTVSAAADKQWGYSFAALEIVEADPDFNPEDGVVTINPTSNGTVTVTNGGVDVPSSQTVTGGSWIIITATPDAGYAPSVTVNDEAKILDENNSCTHYVNGNVTINATFDKVYERSPIENSIKFDIHQTDTHAYMHLTADGPAKSEYYFDLTDGGQLNTDGNYVRIGTSTAGEKNSVKFATGSKTAKMTIEYKSANTSERIIRVADVATNSTIYTDTINNTNKTSSEISLAANTEYYIGANNGMNLYVIDIKVDGDDTQIGETLTTVDNGAVIAVGEDTYIIASIAKSAIGSKDSLTIALPDGTLKGVGDETTPTTTTVFESIMINGTDVAAQLNPAENYYYAIKVVGNKNAKLKNFTFQ